MNRLMSNVMQLSRRISRAIVLLLCALALSLAFTGVGMESASAASPTWLVSGAGRLDGAAGRLYSVALTSTPDGGARGIFTFSDRGAKLRVRAQRVESLQVVDGTATAIGSASVGTTGDYRFRLVLRESRTGTPARVSLDLSGPAYPAYQAEGYVAAGSLRLTDRTSRASAVAQTTTVARTLSPTVAPIATLVPTAESATTTTYDPSQAARLVSADGSVVIDVPAGAVIEASVFEHVAVTPPITVDRLLIGRTFRLDARTIRSGRLVTRFSKPLRLIVRYTPEEMAALGAPAGGPQIYYQDPNGRWIAVPGTVDLAARTITASVDHFTVFAIGTGETFETAGTAGTGFVDTFADMKAWTTVSGSGTVSGNVLTTGATTADDVFLVTNSGSNGDVVYEAAVSDEAIAGEHYVGLIFRQSVIASAQNYYIASLNGGNKVFLRKVVNGAAPSNITSVAFTYSQSTFYWLKVVATGSAIQVFTAGDVGGAPGSYTQRISVTDTTFASGGVGLINDNNILTGVGRFKGPQGSVTLPQSWGSIVQQVGHPGLVWDTTAGSAHGGTGSLQIFGGDTTFVGYAAQTTGNTVTGGTPYTASGWIKTASLSAGASAQIVLVQQPGGTQTIVGSQTTNLGWTPYSASIVLQGGTTSVDTRVLLQGAGTANFDDTIVNVSTSTPTITSTPSATPTMTPTFSPTSSTTRTATPTTTNTPTRTSTATNTPISSSGGESAGTAGALYFTDPLNDQTSFQFSSGAGSVSSGILTTTGAPNVADAFTVTNSDDLTDFTWQGAVNPSQKSANLYAGLQFRWRDAGNYYAWVVNPGNNQVMLAKNSASVVSTLQTNTYTVNASTWYWLRITASGSTFTGAIAPDVSGAPGTWTTFAAVTDASPIVSGRTGLGDIVNGGSTVISANFKGPKLTGTMPSGWSTTGINVTSGHPGFLWNSVTSHSGSRSLQLFAGDALASGNVVQSGVAAVGGMTYQVIGWISTTAVSAGSGGAGLIVHENPSGIETTVGQVAGTTGWTSYSATLTTQASTTSIDLRVQLAGSGEANFDDISITTIGTPTPTATVPAGSTATPTATPTLALNQQALFATNQTSSFTLTNAANSVAPPGSFDGAVASSAGTWAANTTNAWTFTAFQQTSFAVLTDAYIQVSWFQSGWSNDTFALEYSVDNWTTTNTLATYSSANAPPTVITTFASPSLATMINTPAKANALLVRFRGISASVGADTMTLNVDQVRLLLTGAVATPTFTPTATSTPSSTATTTPTASATSSATASATRTATTTASATPALTSTPTRTATFSPTITVTSSPTVTSTTTPPAFENWVIKPDSATTLGNPTPTPGAYNYSGYADSGLPWQTDGSVWGIQSGQGYLVSPPGIGAYVRVLDQATPVIPANVTVSLTVASTAFSGQVGAFARMTPDWNTNVLWIGLTNSGAVEIWTLQNSTWSSGPIATGTATLPTNGAFTILATLSGTTLSLSVAGSPVTLSPSFTIPNPGGNATGAGIYVDSTGAAPWARVTNFSVR